ncbi:MAG: glycosyltransferase [Armatimonadota bacterium]|nr:glycosyltransferase [Armatimonadota bacterium]
MNEMPRVSVLLTSYKHERWLRECVDSALAQSHDDLEVIVVDDNSPDSSVAILESYGDRIRLVANNENRGTYGVLDQALALASGEYVAVLNSDDVWEPAKIEKQVATMGDCVLSFTGGIFIDDSGKEIQGKPMGFPMPTSLPEHPFAQLIANNYIIASSAMLRTSVAREVGGFDDGFKNIGDWNMWLKMAERGYFAFAEGRLTRYRVHASNTISNDDVTQDEVLRLRLAWAEKVSALPGRQMREAAAHSLAAAGRLLSKKGQGQAARRALLKSVSLMPLRLKSYFRYGMTFAGR